MGFGLLFLGYFATTMMEIPLSMLLPNDLDISGIAKVLGYIIIIVAAKKLFEYNSTFKMLIISSSCMACISGAEAIVDISSFLADNQIISISLSGFLDKAISVVEYVSFAFLIIFVSTLCLSVKSIAKDTGVKKIEFAATRNFVFYCILLVVQAVTFIPFKYENYFWVAFIILQLVCWLLNLYMLFTCYAKICDPGDLEMKQKPSRFGFVNRKREEQEAERQKILDEYAEKTKEKKGRRNKKK